ncbi:TerB family tellurite resistance protein, partial [bacterium]|nr:TerB family tellurite resistance protein [bacterium]
MSLELSREMKIMKALVTVAWADNQLDFRELELLNEYIVQFELETDEEARVYKWISNPGGIDTLSGLEFDEDDKLFVFSQVWVMAFIDDQLHKKELLIIEKLKSLWNINETLAEKIKETAMTVQNEVHAYREKEHSTGEILKALSLV